MCGNLGEEVRQAVRSRGLCVGEQHAGDMLGAGRSLCRSIRGRELAAGQAGSGSQSLRWPGSVFPDRAGILELAKSCGSYNTGHSKGDWAHRCPWGPSAALQFCDHQ